jgi:16S rRNA (uracil1498-N3)-methyltransferase
VAHIPRVYRPGHLGPGPVTLDGEVARRLLTVMRLAGGDEVHLFAGDGREWRAEVVSAQRGTLAVTVQEVVRQQAALPVVLELWLAVVRANRMETAIEKCVEAGADIIRPVVCEYSNRGDAGSAARSERWQRIAIEASEQSGRLFLPVIEPPVTFERALSGHHGPLVAGAAGGRSLLELAPMLPSSGRLAVLVGPEGGLSPTESAALSRAGALELSLGPYILRTETAAIAATAALRALTS